MTYPHSATLRLAMCEYIPEEDVIFYFLDEMSNI